MRSPTRAARESGYLVVGSFVNGLAAYAFLALGARSLGPDRFAPVAIVWVFWAFSAALLTFPIQHWVIRQMSLDGNSGGVRSALSRLAAFTGLIAMAEAAVAWVWREALFTDGSWAWPAIVAGVAASSGILGLVRGVLAGSGRYQAAAVAIGGENLIRLLAAAVLLTLGNEPLFMAAALLTGPAVALLWPRLLLLDRTGVARPPSVGLAGATGMSVMAAQVILNSGPPLLSGLGGAEAEVTALFVALALFRAPYLVALGVTIRATSSLTQLVAEGGVTRLRRPSLLIAGASATAAAATYLAAHSLGPPLIRLLFGAGTELPGTLTGAVAAGCVLALGGLALTLVLIAGDLRVGLVSSWGGALLLGAGVVAVTSFLAPVPRVVAGFVAAEAAAVAFTLAAVFAARRTVP
jgi:O-antigen/teichoic acid export membrane protein